MNTYLWEKVTMREKMSFEFKHSRFHFTLLFLSIILAACGGATDPPAQGPTATPPPAVVEPTNVLPTEVEPTDAPMVEDEPMEGASDIGTFELTSTAFGHEAPIPVKYSCDGENVSPPLVWNNPSEATMSFALINDDPDAPVGTWIHWILYNIPGDSLGLDEAIPIQAELPDGSQHGENSWGRFDYGGPCPPGGTHRYFFKLYALDTKLELGVGADKATVLAAMEGHVLAETELMGTYER
jgi:Raf kinase inhibitor-like YbhB/YbcL family protein